MKCPEDADDAHDNFCRAEFRDADDNLFCCTRKEGHDGDHHAHDYFGDCYKVWKDEKENLVNIRLIMGIFLFCAGSVNFLNILPGKWLVILSSMIMIYVGFLLLLIGIVGEKR